MKEVENQGRELGFLGHMEELRSRIIKALLWLMVGIAISAFYVNDLINYIVLEPATSEGLKIQNLKPFGQAFLYFKVAILGGFVISFPMMLNQVWKFIEPGLYKNEKKWARRITIFTSICFLIGIAFAYYVMLPSMMNFAAHFGTDQIENQIDVSEYMSFFIMIILASGLLFELPMITYVLSKLGFVTPTFLRKYRRHAIVLILILAAVITPTPDPITQLIFAAPLFVLYEISIFVSKFSNSEK